MSKSGCVVLLLVLLLPVLASATDLAAFNSRFHDETLRVDYFHGGDAEHAEISLDMVYRQGRWAGSRTRLIDDLNQGRYYVHMYDAASEELLYSRGFDSYFGEYQTTGPAAAGSWRTYHESALLPCPKAPCVVTLSERDDELELQEIFRVELDPDHHTVRREPVDDDVIVVSAHEGGEHHGCVDVAILGEGYTVAEVSKFVGDVQHFAQVMLSHEPYKSLPQHFNIRGVLKVSQDSGCDEPTRGVFARTPLGCTFNSLGSERYLLSEDNRALRDVAAHVPYDALYVMVNTDRYGGGGIYNAFNTFTSDNQWSDYVFLHEFGHHFAGLADEYYTSQIAYSDFYPRDLEPLEPNITRLYDSAQLKWAAAVTPGTALPTPWGKAGYDAMDEAYQSERSDINERIGELMRAGGDAAEIERLKQAGEDLSRTHQTMADGYFARSEFVGQVGAFEGAGYCSEGMYRAELDCIMFSKGIKPFCAACREHIVRVVERYGE